MSEPDECFKMLREVTAIASKVSGLPKGKVARYLGPIDTQDEFITALDTPHGCGALEPWASAITPAAAGSPAAIASPG